MKQETKELKAAKKEQRKIWIRRFWGSFLACMSTAFIMPNYAYAAGASYLDPINKLKTVAISVVAAAGVIVLIYGGVKFAESFQKKDQNGEYSAIYTIVAGAIMVGISAIITALT